MAAPLRFLRRKPPPRHALERPTQAPRRRGDGTTLGVILVLVLTSGFVVGTTATFAGSNDNAGNEFAAAALAVPSSFTAEPTGDDVQLNWTDAIGADSSGAGYRVSVVDWQAAPNSVPTLCGVSSPVYARVGVSQSGVNLQGLLDTGASARANFTDGRLVCYKVQTSYPCCPGGVEGTNPWLSQDSGSQVNPVVVANLGMTLVSFASGNGASSGTLAASDWFEFTFNQPIDPATAITTSEYVCTDTTTDTVWVGVSGTGGSCPQKTGNSSMKDTTFSGFLITKTGGIGVSQTSRFAIASVTFPSCPVNSPPGCQKMRVTLGTRTQGSAPSLSGTYKVEPSSDLNFIKSNVGGVKICGKSTTTTTISGLGLGTYSANPTGGKCIYAGYSFLGKI